MYNIYFMALVIPSDKGHLCPKYGRQNLFQLLDGLLESRDSAVGIVTGYWMGDQGVGFRVPVGTKIFISPYRPDRFLGLPIHLSNDNMGAFPGCKEAGA
jgi:hypothetical protein